MNNKTITNQVQEQQEVIPQELTKKFDNDEELVKQILSQGYTIEELQNSSIIHPTRMDPVCLVNGEPIAIWLYSNNSHISNKNVGYSDDTWEQTVRKRRQQS